MPKEGIKSGNQKQLNFDFQESYQSFLTVEDVRQEKGEPDKREKKSEGNKWLIKTGFC